MRVKGDLSDFHHTAKSCSVFSNFVKWPSVSLKGVFCGNPKTLLLSSLHWPIIGLETWFCKSQTGGISFKEDSHTQKTWKRTCKIERSSKNCWLRNSEKVWNYFMLCKQSILVTNFLLLEKTYFRSPRLSKTPGLWICIKLPK